MASMMYHEAKGRGQIQVRCPDGERRSLYVRAARRECEQIADHVGRLARAAGGKQILDDDDKSVKWLDSNQGKALRPKLERFRIVKPDPAAVTGASSLSKWLDRYFETRTDIKPGTMTTYKQVTASLTEYFGKDKPIDQITEFDAEAWVRWMRGTKKLAKATARRRSGHARMIFRAARKARLVPVNVFEDLVCTVPGNKARARFIDRETVNKIMEHCPDEQWKLIVGLARFGGVRVPSEIIPLKWQDIDWAGGRFLVHSCKTEGYEGHETRYTPLFPELQPLLRAVRRTCPVGEPRVITRYTPENVNLRTQFTRIIRAAGLEPWPRLFNNLRSTRHTELAHEWPEYVVCEWLGHEDKIARKHYCQTRDEDFVQASGLRVVQKVVQSAVG